MKKIQKQARYSYNPITYPYIYCIPFRGTFRSSPLAFQSSMLRFKYFLFVSAYPPNFNPSLPPFPIFKLYGFVSQNCIDLTVFRALISFSFSHSLSLFFFPVTVHRLVKCQKYFSCFETKKFGSSFTSKLCFEKYLVIPN